MAEIDLKKIRLALEEAANIKQQFEEFKSKEGFSQKVLTVVAQNLSDILKPVFEKMASDDALSDQYLVACIKEALTSSKLLNNDLLGLLKESGDKTKEGLDEVVKTIKDSITASQTSHTDLIKAIKDALAGDDSKDSKLILEAIQRGFKDLRIPAPKVDVASPIINVPEPRLIMPSEIRMILDYSPKNPLPVLMVGPDGKPFQFSAIGGFGGGGSARGDFFTLVDIRGSSASIIDQVEGALRVTGNFSISGSASSTLAQLVNADGLAYDSANPLPITGSLSTTPGATFYASDAVGSTNIIQIAGVAVGVGNGETQGGTLRMVMASDSVASTYITGYAGTTTAYLADRAGAPYDGTNPLPVSVSGSVSSTVAVGDIPSGTADTGSAPVKTGGIARTTMPGAAADNNRVSATYDKVGRQTMRTLQVRDLLATAYTTLSNGTETTILTATAGQFLDCIWMMFANTSTAAVQVDVRAVSGGNIVNSVYVPANSTAGWAPPVPWPQDATGNAWTADMGDFTNSNVIITSLFSKEV